MGIGSTLTVTLMATIRESSAAAPGLSGPAGEHGQDEHHDPSSRRILLLRLPDGRLHLAGRQAGRPYRAQELLRP